MASRIPAPEINCGGVTSRLRPGAPRPILNPRFCPPIDWGALDSFSEVAGCVQIRAVG